MTTTSKRTYIFNTEPNDTSPPLPPSKSLTMFTLSESEQDSRATPFIKYQSIRSPSLSRQTSGMSSSYATNGLSKLLYYMDTNDLASLTRYIMQNEPYFTKYKHESEHIYTAFINFKIRGKTVVKYSNIDFCNRLPWIRTLLASLIYDRLRALSDEEVAFYTSKIHTKSNQSENSRKPPSHISITLPQYLPQIDIVQSHASMTNKWILSMCSSSEFQILLFIACTVDGYEQSVIKLFLDAFIALSMTGQQFMTCKRTHFYRILKPHNIKASLASKLYKLLIAQCSVDINAFLQRNNVSLIVQTDCNRVKVLNCCENINLVQTGKYSIGVVNELVHLNLGTKAECIKASQSTINYWDINEVAQVLKSKSVIQDSHHRLEDCDIDMFAMIVHNMCSTNGYTEEESTNVTQALNGMNGSEYMQMKRTQFVRKLKANGIKGAKASKIHKLIMANKDNISEYLVCVTDEIPMISEGSHVESGKNDSNSTVEYSTGMVSVITEVSDISDIVEKTFDKDVIDQLITFGYTKRECIEASMSVTNSSDINEIVDKLNESIQSVVHMKSVTSEQFLICARNLCAENGVNPSEIEQICNALITLNLNGTQFVSMNRVKFCRSLQEAQVKAALSNKVYKLLVKEQENVTPYLRLRTETETEESTPVSDFNLSVNDIADIAVQNFQNSARKMLQKMNQSMKENNVTGMELERHYSSKDSLEGYIKQNVLSKSANNILVDLLWNERNVVSVKEYNRKQLLKYLISLYMYHVKSVIVSHDLNQNKCLSMKRKAICDIFRGECGFSIGVATNIVDKICDKIY